jgi:hypothetical protein
MMHILVDPARAASRSQYGRLFHYHYNKNEYAYANQSKLASSASEADRANLGRASTILSTATYTPNSVNVSHTDDGTAAPCASLPHLRVFSNSPKSPSLISLPDASRRHHLWLKL